MNITTIVTKVVDGDTINVEPFPDGEDSIRLLGIDTPETNYRGHNQGKHADAAKAFLNELVRVGDTVRLETDQEERDKYGRVLAYLFKGDENINVKLVVDGMAAPYQIYPNLKFFHEVRRAAIDARKQKRGIYEPAEPLAELPFEFRMRVDGRAPHKYVGDFQTKIYYHPTEYELVPLQNRVFFFNSEDAMDAGYTMRPGVNLSHVVNKAYQELSFAELLQAQVSALKGLSERDAELLNEAFGIKTIEDLADNKFFKWAQAIKNLAE
ncbi:MAG: thermonuclease family protein [Candidatus Poribacteria bacterium]